MLNETTANDTTVAPIASVGKLKDGLAKVSFHLNDVKLEGAVIKQVRWSIINAVGDKVADSRKQNPEISLGQPGLYTVTLTIHYVGGRKDVLHTGLNVKAPRVKKTPAPAERVLINVVPAEKKAVAKKAAKPVAKLKSTKVAKKAEPKKVEAKVAITQTVTTAELLKLKGDIRAEAFLRDVVGIEKVAIHLSSKKRGGVAKGILGSYSEKFKKPLSDKATVKQLIARLAQILDPTLVIVQIRDANIVTVPVGTRLGAIRG